MPNYSQDSRWMAVTTPLGKDVLLLEKIAGTERLSGLFSFRLDMLAEASQEVAFDQLLGQSITVELRPTDLPVRHLCGIVSRLSQGQKVHGSDGAAAFIRYHLEMVPSLWLLTRKIRSRIFQQLSVPDILKKVLEGLEPAFEIQGAFDKRDYCVQYRESDFAFASRLMEEEGIYYFFKHSADGHKLVVANTPQSHPDMPGPTPIPYKEASFGVRQAESVYGWVKNQELRSGKEVLWDHCFELPDDHLEATGTILDTVQIGTVSHKLKVGGNDSLEVYDYPGRYAQRYDGVNSGGGDQASNLQKIYQDNARTVGIRMQEEAVAGLVIEGNGDCRLMTTGHKFTLDDHFNANGEYVLTAVQHNASIEGAYFGEPVPARPYKNTFQCIPAALPFRPLRVTPRSHISGTQTAVVVGPQGDEIFTDKYGRVKVQFNWDRDGTKDAQSSCWIRVATPWSGAQWGTIRLPRIGQEVIVAFEEGDPDQPVIVGSVYNAKQMPPYPLPDNKTQSGVKSRSSLQGTAEFFNELRFEDKKDNEDIYFHAQKDFHRVVENNDDLKVGKDQTIEIKNNRTETIKEGDETLTIEKGNRIETLKEGNDTFTLKKGNQTGTLEQGNRSITLKQGDDELSITGKQTITISQDQSITISQGNFTLDVSAGNISIKADAGKISVEAAQGIELKVGGNSVVIDPSGVTIKGMAVKVNGEATLDAGSPMTTVKGDGTLTLKGGMTMIN